MNNFSDKAFHDQDKVRVMAGITEHLATAIGANVADQTKALTKAEEQIQGLKDAGFSVPADLAAQTDAYIQSVRDNYQAAVDQATEVLALPESIRSSMQVDVPRLRAAKDSASQWVASIDAMWTPGGGA